VLERDRDRGLGVERQAAGDQLIQHDRDRVQVRGRADRQPLRLFGGQVLGGAHDRAGLGHVRSARAGDPKVGHLRVITVVDDHVLGLQIAMDDAAPVGEARRFEDLDREVDRADRIERRLLADQLLQRPPRQVLHRDVVGAVEGAAVVDADDVRMLQPRGGLGLAAEALDETGILGKPAVQQLQRHLAPELQVLGEEHIGHPARAEPGDDLVAAIDDRA
jgi:hypothetical protein